MRKIVGILNLLIVIIILVAFTMPATAIFPVDRGLKYPKTVWSDMGRTGAVTGRVTLATNGTVGIGGAYIAVVDATNVSREYYNTTSDAYGNYQITGINATYSSVLHQGPTGSTSDYMLGMNMYKIYASKTPYGEGYSAAFGIDANESSAATTSVVIFTKPARIELATERSHVLADGLDNITITATMIDALGNPVADGYRINFTIGNATNNAWNGGFPWTTLNGSLDGAGNRDAIYQHTRDNSGAAGVQFGWVPDTVAGNATYIWAYYADDPSISATVAVSSYAFDVLQTNAEYVSSNLPDSVMVGQTYCISITFKNTGTVPWTESSLIRMLAWGDTSPLGISGDCDNHGCGYPEFAIRDDTIVLPGQEYTWNFTMTPVSAGYTCIGMIVTHNGDGSSVAGIGNAKYASVPVTPTSFDIGLGNAQYLNNTIPVTMVAGNTYNVSVTFNNDGWAPWTESDHVRMLSWGDTAAMGITGDCDNLGCGYPEYAIRPDNPVLLWQTDTWNLTMTPTIPGTYTLGFAMVQNQGSSVTPFGGYGYATVTVT